MTINRRHSWSDPFREQFATQRCCWHCGLLKVTRHEPGIFPWTEYWLNGSRVRMDEEGRRTPPCSANERGQAA